MKRTCLLIGLLLLTLLPVHSGPVQAGGGPGDPPLITRTSPTVGFGWSVAISDYTLLAGAPYTNLYKGAAYVYTFNGDAWDSGVTLNFASLLANNANAGIAVALAGNTAVIGAPGSWGNNTTLGRVYLFTRSGATWNYAGTLTPSDPLAGDRFGAAVDIDLDEDVIVVGAPGNAYGKVYRYVRPGNGWTSMTETNSFTPVGNESGGMFGHSVSVRGSRILVGSPFETHVIGGTGYSMYGAAYFIYYRLFTNTWSTTRFLPVDGDQGDQFGVAVAIGENELFVSSPADTVGSTTVRGSVYIYPVQSYLFSSYTLGEPFKLEPIDPTSSMYYGIKLAYQKDRLIVGASNMQENGSILYYGGAYSYDRPPQGWATFDYSSHAYSIYYDPPPKVEDDHFGLSVATDGNFSAASKIPNVGSMGSVQTYLSTIMLSSYRLGLTESHTTGTFTVKLARKPNENVTVTISANARLTLDQTILTFTPTNWNVAQTIQVSAPSNVSVAPEPVYTIGVESTSTDTDLVSAARALYVTVYNTDLATYLPAVVK